MDTENDFPKRVVAAARELFTTDQAVAQWLRAPAPALGGRRPCDLLGQPDGEAEVLAVLYAIAQGNVL